MRGATFLLVAAAFWATADALSGRAAARERFRLRPSLLVEEEAASSVPQWVRARIEQAVRSLPEMGMFRPDFERTLARAVEEASPWISAVRRVEKLYPNRARVALEVRFPRFWFDVGTERVFVDEDGLVLDRVPVDRAPKFPVAPWRIEGVRCPAPPEPGRPLGDPEFAEAAAVVAELDALDGADAALIRAVEPVAVVLRAGAGDERPSPGVVHLRALCGTLVEWGRASTGRFGPSEIPIRTKLRHLAAVLRRYEGLQGLEEVRLNFGVPYVRPAGGTLEFLPSDPSREP